MSVVVDASVVVAAVADAGREGAWAEGIIGGGSLVSPHLVLVEATDILRRLERAGRLTRLEAGAAARDILVLDLELLPFAPFAERIWELSRGVTSYDAWYVAVAEALDLPLATLDRALAAAHGPHCRFLVPPLSGRSAKATGHPGSARRRSWSKSWHACWKRCCRATRPRRG